MADSLLDDTTDSTTAGGASLTSNGHEVADESPLRRRKKTRPAPPRWPWFLAGVAFGALLLAGVQSYGKVGLPWWVYENWDRGALAANPSGQVQQPQQQPPSQVGSGVDAASLPIREANTLGPANAPVTVIMYSDFQCPFCKRAASSTDLQMASTYAESGKVRIVFKHFAILGNESVSSAVASECAADQGRFWDYHGVLFTNQTQAHNAGAFTADRLIEFAKGLNLDMARFEPCLRNQETLARVQADLNEARSHNFSGTPSYLIGKTPVVGAQSWEAFVQVIEAALNND